MFNGNIYSFYLYVLLIVLSPITVVLKKDDGRIAYNNISDEQILIDLHVYTFAETLKQTFLEFVELFENISVIITINVPKIARDTKIFLEELSNRTVHVLNAFSNKIFKEGDELLKEMLHNFERQLELITLEFEKLATSVDEHFNWAVAQLNYTLINNTEEYDWWTAHIKKKLRTVNDTKLYQEGCQAVEEFINNSTEELHNCCKITMKPMRSICKSASSLITEALHTIVDAIDRMQTCLEEKNSYLEYMLPCVNLAYDDISSLVSRAALITHQINNMLPMKIIYTRSCFALVKVDMNVRRNDIESNLFLSN